MANEQNLDYIRQQKQQEKIRHEKEKLAQEQRKSAENQRYKNQLQSIKNQEQAALKRKQTCSNESFVISLKFLNKELEKVLIG